MGIATVITSGKGGVGKSTLAVGLGRALAKRGRRVLLVDCDAGLRSLDRMTGTEENLVFDMADVVFARCAPAEAIYPCGEAEGLFLLPAPSLGEDMIRPAVMKRLVPLLSRYFDHVLLDSPCGGGRWVPLGRLRGGQGHCGVQPGPGVRAKRRRRAAAAFQAFYF